MQRRASRRAAGRAACRPGRERRMSVVSHFGRFSVAGSDDPLSVEALVRTADEERPACRDGYRRELALVEERLARLDERLGRLDPGAAPRLRATLDAGSGAPATRTVAPVAMQH